MSDNARLCPCHIPAVKCDYHHPFNEYTDAVGVFERGTRRLVCVFPSKQACNSVVLTDRPVVSWHNYYRKPL